MFDEIIFKKHPDVQKLHFELREYFDKYSVKEIIKIAGYSKSHVSKLKSDDKWFNAVATVIRWIHYFKKYEETY